MLAPVLYAFGPIFNVGPLDAYLVMVEKVSYNDLVDGPLGGTGLDTRKSVRLLRRLSPLPSRYFLGKRP